jgi:hypothetical protein
MGCASRVGRGSGSWPHRTNWNIPTVSRVQKRCRAPLATAVQNCRRFSSSAMIDLRRLGVRRQSGAATALSSEQEAFEHANRVARAKAVSRFACHRSTKTSQVFEQCYDRPAVPWSAPAERSGDGAFERAGGIRACQPCGACESGVALRLPPQSKNVAGFRAVL